MYIIHIYKYKKKFYYGICKEPLLLGSRVQVTKTFLRVQIRASLKSVARMMKLARDRTNRLSVVIERARITFDCRTKRGLIASIVSACRCEWALIWARGAGTGARGQIARYGCR